MSDVTDLSCYGPWAVVAGGSEGVGAEFARLLADAEKVPWNPPNALFGPVWSVLYLMIALSGFLLWRWAAKDGRRWDPALTVYVVQLALNAAWTPIFFAGYPVIGEAAWWIALIVILALIVFIGGPTLFILNVIPNAIGSFIGDLPQMASRTAASGDEAVSSWLSSWTVFYWA